jgi:hypothetical protein
MCLDSSNYEVALRQAVDVHSFPWFQGEKLWAPNKNSHDSNKTGVGCTMMHTR